MTFSIWSASAPAPVPLSIARAMLSFGMRASLAFWTAFASAAFISGSPPPSRAATWIARASFVKCAPRRASTTAFLCLIEAHLEWPDIAGEFIGPLVQNGRRLGRAHRVIRPGVAPQLGALVRSQPATHPHDHLDLLEGRAALDALAQSRADVLHHAGWFDTQFRAGPTARGTSDDELAVFLQLLAVDGDRATLAEVADEVPVDGRLVHPAALRIARADRHVHGAAELLIEQHLLGRLGDPVVRPDAELAEAPGSLVGVEHLVQVLLSPFGARVDDLAVLEAEPHAGHLAAAVHGGEREAHLAVHAVLDRTREELPVGHVVRAVAGDPVAPRDVQPHVGAGPHHVDLLAPFDPVGQPLDLLGLALPRRDRVVVVGEAGAVEELLVLGERHVGLRGERLGRVERQRPAVRALGGALHRRLEERLARLLRAGLLGGV